MTLCQFVCKLQHEILSCLWGILESRVRELMGLLPKTQHLLISVKLYRFKNSNVYVAPTTVFISSMA